MLTYRTACGLTLNFSSRLLPAHIEQDWCGDWVTSLCSHSSGLGCTHDDGELEVIMPEPSLEDGMYRVLVTDGEDESNTGCSAAFTLVNQDDASASGVDGEGSLLNVISPREKDGAIAGEGYTVEVCMRGIFWAGLFVETARERVQSYGGSFCYLQYIRWWSR